MFGSSNRTVIQKQTSKWFQNKNGSLSTKASATAIPVPGLNPIENE